MEIRVERAPGPPADERLAEAVERKGLGHPDHICDALAEEFELALARHYLEHRGAILHHNVDKALLWAGRSAPRFGGGEMLEPIEIFLAGRAAGGDGLSVEELARETACRWLAAHVPELDVERHVRIHCLVRPTSGDLVALYARARSEETPLANDTSCGVGYAPLSRLERVVLEVERHLTRDDAARQPAFGPDVKVMGTRQGDRMHLTIACAMVDRHLAGPSDYLAAVQELAKRARERAESLFSGALEVEVNGADDRGRGSFYLTVTGTSAEAGDDGQTGRGNRVNGLITPYRPMTLESVAGKNPISHVGKLYNLCAGLAAQEIVEALPEALEAECRLVSRIGRPIDEPQFAEIELRCRKPIPDRVRARAGEIARDHVGRIASSWRDLLDGTLILDDWPLRRRVREGRD